MYQRRDNFCNNKNKYLQNNQIACGVYFLYNRNSISIYNSKLYNFMTAIYLIWKDFPERNIEPHLILGLIRFGFMINHYIYIFFMGLNTFVRMLCRTEFI